MAALGPDLEVLGAVVGAGRDVRVGGAVGRVGRSRAIGPNAREHVFFSAVLTHDDTVATAHGIVNLAGFHDTTGIGLDQALPIQTQLVLPVKADRPRRAIDHAAGRAARDGRDALHAPAHAQRAIDAAIDIAQGKVGRHACDAGRHRDGQAVARLAAR